MKTPFVFLITAAALCAQVDHNADAWFMYFGDHPFGRSRFGAHLEGQWRRTKLGLAWQQQLLRPARNYQLSKTVMLTGGYCFVETYRYGDYPAQERFPEHRVFEQMQINSKFLGADWSNRLRLEQRNILGYAARYENRFRYMLRATIPLRWDQGNYYLGVYDEIFINFGRNVAFNTFDQNRAYVALGRHLGRQTRLEIGFMEQTVQQRNGRIFENNHTLQVAIFSKLPFGGHE
jgi:hypothetical protein